MAIPAVSLDDKYTAANGRIYLTGVQALVRLALLQRRRDAAAGLNTAGFISGYRGSPLAGLDRELWAAREHLDRHAIRFQPAINEELAATAVLGTQQVNLYPGARPDGVFALWYGKGPGLDRAGDALKHANSIGTAPKGGVLVVVGDDHGAISSSLAHQGEPTMAAWGMPVLHPASVSDIPELGLFGLALSRYAGCCVGLKLTSEVLETSAAIDVDAPGPQIAIPADFAPPPDGLHIRWPDPQLAQEERLYRRRLPAAQAFARANRIDRVVVDGPNARYGVVGVGKAYADLRQALADLGLDDAAAARLGLRLYKVGMPWPLEPEGARAFARGLREILVVEEKRGLVEEQLKQLLYDLPDSERPRVVGKLSETGGVLLPATGELNPAMIARALATRLRHPELEERYWERLTALDRERRADQSPAPRLPHFCPGCPHSQSTRIPAGSRAHAGTGCHLMVALADPRTTGFLQMGGEGVNWIGQAPFTDTPHIFQNLGDGTYVHSGSMAIRQAVAAGANITYKILFNDAVAMTGGQPFEVGLTVPNLSQQLHHEGVRRIAVVADDPGKYPAGTVFAPGTSLHPRDELERVQAELATWPGVSALIYDQACATEARRRRKRNGEKPRQRVMIDPDVCEGCGDCVERSGCAAVVPLATPEGVKRAIDQSACAQDLSCLAGFCPALVTVAGAAPRTVAAHALAALPPLPPAPVAALERPYGIVIAGVGGRGVVTAAALLGMAARLDGRGVQVLDMPGLAQKGGGVQSHIRIAPRPADLHAPRIGPGDADLLVAADPLTAAAPATLSKLKSGGNIVADADAPPTGAAGPAPAVSAGDLIACLRAAAPGERLAVTPAARIAERVTGDSVTANLVLIGYAWQRGRIPLSAEAIDAAIALNGVAVEANRRAFLVGRHLAADETGTLERLGLKTGAPEPESLDALIERNARRLAGYQDAELAERHRAFVARVRAAEGERASSDALTRAVARHHARLLAPKDEYEVARLYTTGRFGERLAARFGDRPKVYLHLAPSFLAPRDPVSGQPLKRRFGPWIFPALRLLAGLRRLRGTPFDPFALQAERRQERALAGRYEALVEELLARLDRDNHARAVEIADLAHEVRGFGPVKAARLARVEARWAALLTDFRNQRKEARAAA